MGFFDLKAVCAACNREIGLNRFQIANKEWICMDCFKKCNFNALTPIKKMTLTDINNAIRVKEANTKELTSFNTTKKYGSFIEFDDNQKKWLVPDGLFGKKKNPRIYNYSDILDFELLEDGESVTQGGLGRALAGGVMFGNVGAVVGGVTGKRKSKGICSSLKIKITVNDMNNSAVFINFLNAETKKESFSYKALYKLAQECLSTLQLICSNQQTPQISNNNSSADEILKYKSLMDSGIISPEEFESKKKQLLGL